MTLVLSPEENGERHRAKVTRKVVEIIDEGNGHRVENIILILDMGNGKVEQLISYNQLLEHLNRILALLTLIPFLQYFNQRFPRCLCSGTEGLAMNESKLVKMPLHGSQRV